MSQRNMGVTVLDKREPSPRQDLSPREDLSPQEFVEPLAENCPVREVLERISGKWSIQILIAAANGPVRFTELERKIEGISRRMLTLTLRSLERDGLLIRTVYPTVPPKVDYTVTPMARELYESFLTLMDWAQRNRPAISAARQAYDRAALQDDLD